MKTQTDFSELQEAAQLLSRILEAEEKTGKDLTASDTKEVANTVNATEKAVSPVAAAEKDQPSDVTAGSRGDRIEKALEVLCKRGGFSGAVIADINGLPLAVYNSPVGVNALAAFTSVLGSALEKAGHLLEQHGADNISMDINYADKIVLRRFSIKGLQYYLMVICPQNIDERSEIELSLEQIVAILS